MPTPAVPTPEECPIVGCTNCGRRVLLSSIRGEFAHGRCGCGHNIQHRILPTREVRSTTTCTRCGCVAEISDQNEERIEITCFVCNSQYHVEKAKMARPLILDGVFVGQCRQGKTIPTIESCKECRYKSRHCRLYEMKAALSPCRQRASNEKDCKRCSSNRSCFTYQTSGMVF